MPLPSPSLFSIAALGLFAGEVAKFFEGLENSWYFMAGNENSGGLITHSIKLSVASRECFCKLLFLWFGGGEAGLFVNLDRSVLMG